MPFYKVQLKQGRRTVVNRIEAKSVESCKRFFEELTTMKVTEILEIKYQATSNTIPVDDFNYNSLYKGFIKNTSINMSFQIVLNNLKKNKSEDDIYNTCVQYLEIAGKKVDSCVTSLFKQ